MLTFQLYTCKTLLNTKNENTIFINPYIFLLISSRVHMNNHGKP